VHRSGYKYGLSEDIFREQMRRIKKSFNVLTLEELLFENYSGRFPENAVVVTFDDGYYDFSKYAFPIMKEEGIRPTLFITTGFVNGDLWLWPDKIRYALDNTCVDEFGIDQISTVLNLKLDAERAWHLISDYCLTIKNHEKEVFIRSLYRKLEVKMPTTPPRDYRPVSWNEVREMMKDGLDVGSHSHSHPILTKLNEGELSDELKKSKELILKELKVTTRIFCYPNGQRTDFNDKVKEYVSDAGYQYAVSAFPAMNPLACPFELNRYSIDNNMDNFEKVLYGLSFLALKAENNL
jgi:peptidoglycan/xylan/chitin deacetylase (PgdA/CDA1 family)|tara:strand:- start:7127 stop:8008 length:882 start_codon:yes stop_codon:yes gene_type:complete